MSVRVDTSSLISGAVVCGNRGLGDTGFTIRTTTATGSNGPGLIYPSLDGTNDDTDEFMFRITTPPSSGTLFVDEPGSFSFSAPDGSYSLIGDLYKNGTNLGSITFVFNVGRIALLKTNNLAYFIRDFIAKSLVNNYFINGNINKTLTTNYFIRNSLSKSFGLNYAIRDYVNKSFGLSYMINGSILKSNDLNYFIRDLISKTNTFNYEILSASFLQKQLSLNYNIRGSLNKSVTFMYEIGGVVYITKSLTLMYEILGDIPDNTIVIVLYDNEPITITLK